MKKIFILFWMLCGITLNALAQEQLEISGTVTDATGEALIGVSVTVKDAKGLGTITNIDGKYNIKIEQAMRKIGDNEGVNVLNGITEVGLRVEKR